MPSRVGRRVAQWNVLDQPWHTQRRVAERAVAGRMRAGTAFRGTAAGGMQLSWLGVAQRMDGTQKHENRRTIPAAGGNKLGRCIDQAEQTAYAAMVVVRSCMSAVGNDQVAEVVGQPSNQVANGSIHGACRLDVAPGKEKARSRTPEASCAEVRQRTFDPSLLVEDVPKDCKNQCRSSAQEDGMRHRYHACSSPVKVTEMKGLGRKSLVYCYG